jgi:hypothetical protein
MAMVRHWDRRFFRLHDHRAGGIARGQAKPSHECSYVNSHGDGCQISKGNFNSAGGPSCTCFAYSSHHYSYLHAFTSRTHVNSRHCFRPADLNSCSHQNCAYIAA